MYRTSSLTAYNCDWILYLVHDDVRIPEGMNHHYIWLALDMFTRVPTTAVRTALLEVLHNRFMITPATICLG